MKRLWTILFALLLTLTLCSCAEQETTYTVNKNGTDFYVDTTQQTISDGTHTYRYKFSGDADSFSATITFPDGSSYWWQQTDGSGSGGWSGDYVDGKYASANTLIDVLQENAPKRTNPNATTAALLLMALGLFEAVFPKATWYLGYGWRYKDAEPSDAALLFSRLGGIAATVIGFVLLVI